MTADNSNFSAALKRVRVDDRGRVNIGSIVQDAKGGEYEAAVDGAGRILLTPAPNPQRAVERG